MSGSTDPLSDPMTDALFEATARRFYRPDGCVYLDGNSLGLLSRDSEAEVLRVIDEWKRLGVRGWLEGDPPWFTLCEELAARVAPLVGAAPESVAVTGSTTGNIHALVATLYRPSGERRRILSDALNFPTDRYALHAQAALRGFDPSEAVRLVASADGNTLDEDAIVAAMDDTIALVFLPSVLYRSGQLIDMERITAAARARKIPIGWDLSHSIGCIPHRLDAWDADFAVWCHYKYLNAGPGAVAGLYLNRRHAEVRPALPGWWGFDRPRRFDMEPEFVPAAGAARFAVGTPPILGIAGLAGSLHIVEEVGIEAIRQRSLRLTDRLISLVDRELPPARTGLAIITPRPPSRRGGHVAITHPGRAVRLNAALKARGIIPDFRPPDTIRLCPSPLYTLPSDIDSAVGALREILEGNEDLALPDRAEPVA